MPNLGLPITSASRPIQGKHSLSAARLAKLQAGRAKARGEARPPKKRLKVPFSPIKSIRKFCVECCGGSSEGVRFCGATDSCVLWFYRFGTRPKADDEMMDTKNFKEDGKFWPQVMGDNGSDTAASKTD